MFINRKKEEGIVYVQRLEAQLLLFPLRLSLALGKKLNSRGGVLYYDTPQMRAAKIPSNSQFERTFAARKILLEQISLKQQ